jgi:hypothetical protein
MKQTTDIKIERSADGEYPPGEEWRGKLREAIELLIDLVYHDQWIKVFPIEPENVNRVRSTAHFFMGQWQEKHLGEFEKPFKLVTRYDPTTKIFWMSTQPLEREKGEDEEEN